MDTTTLKANIAQAFDSLARPIVTAWKSSPTIAAIAAALVKAQAAMTNPLKTSKNPFFNSKYADLAEVRESCLPEFNAAGITVMQHPSATPEGVEVETMLLHESGEWISSRLWMPFTPKKVKGKEVNPNDPPERDPQVVGILISYCRRYALQSIACLAAEDDDGESAMGRGRHQEQQPARQQHQSDGNDAYQSWKKAIDNCGDVTELNRLLTRMANIEAPDLKRAVWGHAKAAAASWGLEFDQTLKVFIQPTKQGV